MMSIYSVTKHASLVALTMIVVVLLVISTAQAASIEDPEIVTRDGQDVLLLPDSLETLIASTYPGFRVPDNSDLSGFWARFKFPGSFPFMTLGDFNGDGLTDVVLILIGDDRYKKVIFHKTSQGYAVALELGNTFGPQGVVESPQWLHLGRIRKGEDYEFVEFTDDQGEDHVFTFHAENDSIITGSWESQTKIIHWQDGEYKRVYLGGGS